MVFVLGCSKLTRNRVYWLIAMLIFWVGYRLNMANLLGIGAARVDYFDWCGF